MDCIDGVIKKIRNDEEYIITDESFLVAIVALFGLNIASGYFAMLVRTFRG